MTEDRNKIPQKKKQAQEALAQQRRDILSLAPEASLDAVVNHPLPVTLVQSFAEEDLYLLVHTIGLDDAVPVLAMASNEQWEYFLDMEMWQRDRMDPVATTQWLDRLLKADPDRFTHWIVHDQCDNLVFYLKNNIDVFVREHDQDPSDLGDGFHTEDHTYYVRPKPFAAKTDEQKLAIEERDQFLKDLLKRISVYDYQMYTAMLSESSSLIPAEMEEELYRLRNVRLAEKGFLPHEEAVGIYQPLDEVTFFQRPEKTADDVGGRILETYPWPTDASAATNEGDLFARTLAQIKNEGLLLGLQTEFAGLCNQIIAADQLRVKDKRILDKVVAKTGGYISIGLEKLAALATEHPPYACANLVSRHYLSDLFRVGYGCALTLKWKADRWVKTSWFSGNKLPISFWGEDGMGLLGGLLIKKPLYFDNYATGDTLYREFASLADIDRTDQGLKEIIAFDDIFSLIAAGLHIPENVRVRFLTHHSLLLTLWANHYLDIGTAGRTLARVPMSRFKSFFRGLWSPDKQPRKVNDAAKSHFLEWLAVGSGLHQQEITDRMGPALDKLFHEIETELGQVEEKDIDPRFVVHFLLSSEEE